MTPDLLDRVQALVQVGVDVISIDTAHGHSKGVIDALKSVKKAFPTLDVIVGNIATGEAAVALAEAGADAVKVGCRSQEVFVQRVLSPVWVCHN